MVNDIWQWRIIANTMLEIRNCWRCLGMFCHDQISEIWYAGKLTGINAFISGSVLISGLVLKNWKIDQIYVVFIKHVLCAYYTCVYVYYRYIMHQYSVYIYIYILWGLNPIVLLKPIRWHAKYNSISDHRPPDRSRKLWHAVMTGIFSGRIAKALKH